MTFSIKPVAIAKPEAKPAKFVPTAFGLTEAAKRFTAAGQTNNAAICTDMATKLARFGSFVSEKQEAFALSLVERSNRLAAAPAPVAPPKFLVPDLFAVMQKHSHFYVGDVTLARKNQDTLVWIKHSSYDGVVGKIVNGEVTLWSGRLRDNQPAVEELLNELEQNPLAAAMKYGKLSGRCCSCGRDLTDPVSIEAGIGPVCATKFE